MDLPLKQKFVFFIYYYNIELCNTIKDRYQNTAKYIILLLSPFMLVSTAIKLLFEMIIARPIVKKQLTEDATKVFPHELAVVAIAKNEGPYLKEWIEYHVLQGVTKIYLYDNESTDDTKRVVSPYVEKGVVEYIWWPGEKKQLPCYNDAISRFKHEARYFVVIDCDEFIQPLKDESILKVVTRCLKNCSNAAGLAINWMLWGSGGEEEKRDGLVMDRFRYRAKEQDWPNRHIKTICNPRFVKNYISPHFPLYKMGCYSISSKGKRTRLWFIRPVEADVIRCNHYFCKSKQEWLIKRNRGMADRIKKYDLDKFSAYDLNEVLDESMQKYVNKLV